MTRYVVLLRAIAHVEMGPFRRALTELGFTDVVSFGMSGNFLFNASSSDPTSLERLIAARFRTAAFVRTRAQLARLVAQDPFRSSVMVFTRSPTAARRRAFLELEFEHPCPVLRGSTVYLVHPARLRGRRATFDFERGLDVPGTARSSRIVARLLDLPIP